MVARGMLDEDWSPEMVFTVEKVPHYLSPSSLKKFEHQPYTFALSKLLNEPAVKEEKGLPAAIGTVFDYLFKREVLLQTEDHKLKAKQARVDKLTDGIDPALHDQAFALGQKYFDFYKRRYPKIFKQTVNIEGDDHLKVAGVPLYGKLDLTLMLGKKKVVCDLKTTNPLTDKSPPKLYVESYDSLGKEYGSHKEWHSEICMDEIDRDWATQLCTYGFFERMSPIDGKLVEFDGMIHYLSARGGNLRVSEYYGRITTGFQLEVINRYRSAWKQLPTFLNGEDLQMIYWLSQFESWY